MAEQAEESLGQRMRSLRGEARLRAIGEVVAQWRQSGQSQAVFCREAGIATVTLGRWLKQLAAGKAMKAKAPVLVELGTREVVTEDAFEVVLSGGIWLRVPSAFGEADLKRLLGVLSSAC